MKQKILMQNFFFIVLGDTEINFNIMMMDVSMSTQSRRVALMNDV